MVKKKPLPYPWNQLCDDNYWFLLKKDELKIKWFKRKKIHPDILKLMNGEKVKLIMNMKDWKCCKGKFNE